jgi:branched-chain amino acid transport system substrate-binding protein
LTWKLPPLLCLLVFAGCLGVDDPGEAVKVPGRSATVYASLPAHGVLEPAGRAVEAGARLALADAGGRAGGLQIELRRLSSTEPAGAPWDPGIVNENADRAAGDPRAIAYLGELGYGASAISLPITNGARLLQVSPEDGLTSLTRTPPGRPRSLPERLRPSGERNFVRLTPTDLLQAETLVELMRARGTERPAVLFDQDVYGRELGAQVIARARRDGREPVGSQEYRGKVEEIPDLVAKLAESRPDTVVYAGLAGPGTGRLLAAVDSLMPGVPVYAGSGLLARDRRAPIPDAPLSVEALAPTLPMAELPAEGREIIRRLRRAEGGAAARSEAVYGYEAMRLILDAVERGGRERARVTAAALGMRERSSPLGEYRVRGTGDVESERFALYALLEGRFELVRMVD